MNDKAFQDLILEELRAIKIRQDAHFKEFTKFRTEEFTNFKVAFAEERAFSKGNNKQWTTGIISVIASAVTSFLFKLFIK